MLQHIQHMWMDGLCRGELDPNALQARPIRILCLQVAHALHYILAEEQAHPHGEVLQRPSVPAATRQMELGLLEFILVSSSPCTLPSLLIDSHSENTAVPGEMFEVLICDRMNASNLTVTMTMTRTVTITTTTTTTT